MLAKSSSKPDLPETLEDAAPLPYGLWERLSKEAQDEYWCNHLDILQNLCRQHYRRLRDQKRLLRGNSGQIYMNTSLRSRESREPIILVFLPDTTPDGSRDRKPYGPPQVVIQGDKGLQGLTPPLATWFDDCTLRFFRFESPLQL